MNKKTITLVLIIILSAGIGLSAFFYFKRSKERSVLYAKIAAGTIKSVSETEIAVDFDTFDPAVDKTPKPAGIFRLAEELKVYELNEEMKSQDQYDREQVAFNRLLAELAGKNQSLIGLEPPARATEKTADRASLVAGIYVRLYGIYDGQQGQDSEIYKIVIDGKFKLNPSSAAPEMEKNTVLTFSGKISNIFSDRLELSLGVADPSTGATSTTGSGQIVLRFGADTKIYATSPKPAADYAKEIADFNRQLREFQASGKDTAGLTSPDAFVKTQLDQSQLKRGDSLSVRATKAPSGDFIAGDINVN